MIRRRPTATESLVIDMIKNASLAIYRFTFNNRVDSFFFLLGYVTLLRSDINAILSPLLWYLWRHGRWIKNKRPFFFESVLLLSYSLILTPNPCLLSACIFTCDLSGGRYDMERGEWHVSLKIETGLADNILSLP